MGGYSHERKHLIFKWQPRGLGKKTDTWLVMNGESQLLALITYRAGWRRYVTRYAYEGVVDFDSKCHRQAADFCDKQTAKLKAKWKKRKGTK